MAQQLRALAALLKDSGLIPSTHSMAYNYLTLVPWWPARAPGEHVVHRYTCKQNTLTHKMKLKSDCRFLKVTTLYYKVEATLPEAGNRF